MVMPIKLMFNPDPEKSFGKNNKSNNLTAILRFAFFGAAPFQFSTTNSEPYHLLLIACFASQVFIGYHFWSSDTNYSALAIFQENLSYVCDNGIEKQFFNASKPAGTSYAID